MSYGGSEWCLRSDLNQAPRLTRAVHRLAMLRRHDGFGRAGRHLERPKPSWSRRRGSNPQPSLYKSAALPLSYAGTFPGGGARAMANLCQTPGSAAAGQIFSSSRLSKNSSRGSHALQATKVWAFRPDSVGRQTTRAPSREKKINPALRSLWIVLSMRRSASPPWRILQSWP